MSDKEEQSRSVHLKFSEDEISAIDSWQEQKHIRTRSEAIRQLVHRALKDSSEVSEKNISFSEGESNFTSPKSRAYANNDISLDSLEEKIENMVKAAVQRALSEGKS